MKIDESEIQDNRDRTRGRAPENHLELALLQDGSFKEIHPSPNQDHFHTNHHVLSCYRTGPSEVHTRVDLRCCRSAACIFEQNVSRGSGYTANISPVSVDDVSTIRGPPPVSQWFVGSRGRGTSVRESEAGY